MDTTPFPAQPQESNSNKHTRLALIGAVAAGALTLEGANHLLHRYHPEAEPINPEDIVPIPEPEPEPAPSHASSHPHHAAQPEEAGGDIHTPNNDPDPEPVPVPSPEPYPSPDPDPYPNPDPDPHPEPVPEPNPDDIVIPEPAPLPAPDDEDEIIDGIIEEIDPNDFDIEDVILVDDIGQVYTYDGDVYNAALIHDGYGQQAMIVDMDYDNVYDTVMDEMGNTIGELPSNIDLDYSDVELLYAQQHDESGYLGQNEYDQALNDTPDIDIQDDMLLS